MKTIISILFFTAVLMPFNIYADESYQSEKISFTFSDTGDWQLYDSINKATYLGQWYGPVMKVVGDDGTCFWLAQTPRGLEQSDCDLRSISILIYQLDGQKDFILTGL